MYVHKIEVYLYQVVFQITFIRKISLIRIPLFQASIAIFFYTKMKDFMQGASKTTGKALKSRRFCLSIAYLFFCIY